MILQSVQHHITEVFLSQNLYSHPPDMRNHSLSPRPHSVESATTLLCTPQVTNTATLKYKIIWAINFFVWMNYCWFSQEYLHFIRGSKEKKKKKTPPRVTVRVVFRHTNGLSQLLLNKFWGTHNLIDSFINVSDRTDLIVVQVRVVRDWTFCFT